MPNLEDCDMYHAYYSNNYESDDEDDFVDMMSGALTANKCNTIEQLTTDQTDSPLWWEMRYGRITASKIWSARRGISQSMRNNIMQRSEAVNAYENASMRRGKDLEPQVRACLAKRLGVTIRPSGVILNGDYPIFAASPDGIGKNFVVEIKCPTHWGAFQMFYKHGKMSNRTKSQLRLQMLLAKKNIGYFCIAHPDFERTKDFTLVTISQDMEAMDDLIESATESWENDIFPYLGETTDD